MEVVVIEDERLATSKIIMLLKSIDPEIVVKATLSSVEESKKWFSTNQCDLIFSDINLSDDLSFNIFKEMRVETPIIFTTAYDEYAIRAFEQNSLAYLLKPIDKEELAKSIDKFHNLNKRSESMLYQKLDNLIAQMSTRSVAKDRFSVSYGGKMRSIAAKDIAMFFVKSKVVYLITRSGSKYVLDKTLEKIENEVSGDFFRVNRQYLIHIDNIEEVIPYSSRKLRITPRVEAEENIIVPSDKITEFKKWFEG
ncbi:MAG: response regulator transcription factor [Cyclobacteriaceae bacterium]